MYYNQSDNTQPRKVLSYCFHGHSEEESKPALVFKPGKITRSQEQIDQWRLDATKRLCRNYD